MVLLVPVEGVQEAVTLPVILGAGRVVTLFVQEISQALLWLSEGGVGLKHLHVFRLTQVRQSRVQ